MKRAERSKFSPKNVKRNFIVVVRQELQFESNGKEKFALLILTLITRPMNGASNPVLFDAGAVLHKLSYQANWFQVVMWVDCKPFQSAFQIHENSLYYHHQ